MRHYFENHGNVAECVQKLRTNFGRREAPSAPYVRYLVKKVKETGMLIDKPKRKNPKTVRTPENISAVAESVCEAPPTSIYRRSQQLNISETSLRRILHKNAIHDRSFGSGVEANLPSNASFSTIEHFGDIGMTPYKVQLVQELKPIHHPMRFRFAKWACDRLTEDCDFVQKKIIFSDEAHFDIGGYVKKHAYNEKPMQPKRVTVCCGFWSRGIIGQFFFEYEQGEAVTANGDCYRPMLNAFLFTKIEEENIGNIWFQQDGST